MHSSYSLPAFLRRALTRAAQFALAGVAIACAAGDSPGPAGPPLGDAPPVTPSASAMVAMNSSDDGYGSASNSFTPNNVYIVRDGTVTWSNGTGLLHNVTFSATTGAPTNVGAFNAGSQERTFGSSGTFNYSCTLHAGMTGTVRVQ